MARMRPIGEVKYVPGNNVHRPFVNHLWSGLLGCDFSTVVLLSQEEGTFH